MVAESAELVDEVAVDEQQDAAARRLAELLSPAAIDSLIADAEASGMGLDGTQGLFNQMTKAVLERALQIEMADHLGYEKGDPAGQGSGNSRNGMTDKNLITNSGPVQLNVPRDRAGTFEPKIVPKRTRRLGSVDDMILSLYARGVTTRDIKEHLAEVYGAEVSPGLISNVTDVVQDEITQWQTRPIDAVYPIVYIDAIVVKIREGGTVDNRAAHLAIGVDVDGFKHVLGIWIAENEGAKFWQNVLNELVNRGLNDALIVCCDGLTGLPDAIANVWPKAIVQTCVVHLIRASTRFVSQNDRKAVIYDSLAVILGNEASGRSNEVHHACLHDRFRPHVGDRVGQSGQPVAADDQRVVQAAVDQLVEDVLPELRTLVLGNPDAQDVLEPINVDPDSQVSGPVVDRPALTDLDHDRVDIHNRINSINRTRLPLSDLILNHIGDIRDQSRGNLGPVHFRQMFLDVPSCHPPRIQRQNHIIDRT